MRKMVAVLGFVVAMFVSMTTYATECQIECLATVNGTNVSISGVITNVTKSEQVTLLVGSEADIIHIDQIASATDGSFTFNFPLRDGLANGIYSYHVGTSANAEKFSGTFLYEEAVEYEERQFANADITIAVNMYVPMVTGTISCIEGKTINFRAVNTSDNTIIVDDNITSAEDSYNLNYTLPSLVTGKDYIVTVSCTEDELTLFSITAEINSSIVLVEASGEVQVADNVRLDVRAQTTNSNLIDKSATINSNQNLSLTIPNLVAYMSCDIDMQAYEVVETGTIPEPEPTPDPEPDPEPDPTPEPEPDPEPLPDADEVFQAIEIDYIVEGSAGSMSRVMLNINNIPTLHEKVFTINYDSTRLELIDVCSFTNTKELTTGMVVGTYIEILSVMDGQVRFKINKTFSDKVVTSGVINMMTFKKLNAEEVVITSKVEKDSNIQ